jgi:hypothetical protein
MAPDTVTPQPAKEGGTASATGTAGWQWVRDLPTPPELAREIEAECRQRGFHRWWRRRLRSWLEDDLKLRYHYAGKVVAVMNSDRGPVVIAVGDSLDSPNIAHLFESLPPEVNQRTALDFFPPRDDDTSRILTGCL